MQYAAIDMGTNSCRLFIARFIDDRIEPVYQQIRSNRLGEGLAATGNISEKAMQRTVDCIEEYKMIMKEKGVDDFCIVATSAVREAKNKKEFIQFLKKHCDVSLEVASGQKEAQLSYSGVINDWQEDSNPLVIDLGGGSTEIIWQEEELFCMSLPIGAVKATETLMSAGDIAQTISALSSYKERLARYPLVMVGGTATTLVAVKLALDVYDAKKVHGQKLIRSEIADIYNILAKMPLPLRKRMPGLQPERADIIVKGTMIVLLMMDFLGKEEITVSENDILSGIVWELYNGSSRKV